MAAGTKVGEGKMLDYAHTAAVGAGEIQKVVSLVMLASRKAAANEGIGWHTEGLFDMPKASGVGSGIAFGTKVYWNSAAGQVTATASGNTAIGFAAPPVGADTALLESGTVRVRLAQNG